MNNQIANTTPEEFDDVLSSIRKLVSEEAQARGGEIRKAVEEKLVLTPEFRVPDARPQPLRLDTPVAPDASQQGSEPAATANERPEAPFHDEVALRALVSEMIREELQGELGARITRNVRKLIKREVAEALAAARQG